MLRVSVGRRRLHATDNGGGMPPPLKRLMVKYFSGSFDAALTSDAVVLDSATTVPHPRSPFAVMRKLPAARSRAGECARKVIQRRPDDVPCCCGCSALLIRTTNTEANELSDVIMLDVLFAFTILRHSSFLQREVHACMPSLDLPLFDERAKKSLAAISGCMDENSVRAVSLCSDVAVQHGDSNAHVALLLLSMEEADEARDICMALHDEVAGSEREKKKLLSIKSLRVLLAVATIRAIRTGRSFPLPSTGLIEILRSSIHSADIPPWTCTEVVLAWVLFVMSGSTSSDVAGMTSHFFDTFLLKEFFMTPQHTKPSTTKCLLTDSARSLMLEMCHWRLRTVPFKDPQTWISWTLNVGLCLEQKNFGGTSHLLELCFTACLESVLQDATLRDAVATAGSGLAASLALLFRHLVGWSRHDASQIRLRKEHSELVAKVCDSIIASVARHNPETAVCLLRDAGHLDPLNMPRVNSYTLPLLQRIGSDDLAADAISALLAATESVYLGGQGPSRSSAAAHIAIRHVVSTKRERLLKERQESSLASTSHYSVAHLISDHDIVVSILDDLADLGKVVYDCSPTENPLGAQAIDVTFGGNSPTTLRTTFDENSLPDPNDALLGGPVHFLKFLFYASRRVQIDVSRKLKNPFESVSDAHDGSTLSASGSTSHHVANENHVQVQGPLLASAVAKARFASLLEAIVKALLELYPHVPLENLKLASLIEARMDLPSLHDEYRRKLFLLVNITPASESSRAPTRISSDEPDHAVGRETIAVRPELQKLTASLQHLFLPWTSIQIAEDVLVRSRGQDPRYLYLFQTLVDLQLPPSTARSRIASVLRVYKLIRSQRSKLRPSEYHELVHRCLWSVPLSYLHASWTFFAWWTFIGVVACLHIFGWSYESVFVVDHRRGEFAKELQSFDGVSGAQEGALVAQTPANWDKVHFVVTGGVSENRLLGCHLRRTRDFVFVLRGGLSVQNLGCIVADEVISDAAQRIRKEANTTSDPLKRFLMNLFPLYRYSAELNLVQMVIRQADRCETPITFVLPLAYNSVLSEDALQSLRAKLLITETKASLIVLCESATNLSQSVRHKLAHSSNSNVNDTMGNLTVISTEKEHEPITTQTPWSCLCDCLSAKASRFDDGASEIFTWAAHKAAALSDSELQALAVWLAILWKASRLL